MGSGPRRLGGLLGHLALRGRGRQEDLVTGIKALTPRPVVGVGRFTSPDAMVRQVKAGILDFIGAARPSIADPFLPKKIDEGRIDDIRECIGCNICVTGDMTMSLSRCTQNPAFMEEWRKGWHPETHAGQGRQRERTGGRRRPGRAGGGPGAGPARIQGGAGRGGDGAGRPRDPESRLPGLAAWGRVRDYRLGQILKMPNVEVYYDSLLAADQVLEFGFENVAIATGATWRRDGVARHHLRPIAIDAAMPVFTPDDLMAGNMPKGARSFSTTTTITTWAACWPNCWCNRAAR